MQVRDAFVWRPPAADPQASPSAADYLLGEGCAIARGRKIGRGGAAGNSGGGTTHIDVARCLL